MASFIIGTSDVNTLDDDLSAIIGEYSIPNLTDITSESLLTQSQYAKVIFHDLLPCYPTDADIWCHYSLTDGITSRHGDRVALYRVGWSSVHDHVQFEVAPMPSNQQDKEFQVLFKAENLPKDSTEFYQLCYVNVDDSVCGASVPFQFRRPSEEELCEVEEQGGLLVVRSRTAINGDKLRDAAKLIDELETEKQVHEEKIQALENTKDSLSLKLEELTSIQSREQLLKQDIELLDIEKNRAFANLHQAEKHIQDLKATIKSMRQDNAILSGALKSESHKASSAEVSRLQIQLDNTQQMLDALSQSKELAQQALQCEQSKVMALNIEHDKYKFRAQHLEEENNALKLELQQCMSAKDALVLQLKQSEACLQLKDKESETTSKALIQQIGQSQFELRQVRDNDETLQLQIRHRDNQISMMQNEFVELRKRWENFDQLNEEHSKLKRQLKVYQEKHATVEQLQKDNFALQFQVQKLQSDVSLLKISNQEKDNLSSEHELLSAEHEALQQELYASSLNSTNVQELKDQNASLQNQLAHLSKKETELNQSTVSLEQLKSQLAKAEASNASLLHELQQIRVAEESDCNAIPILNSGNTCRTRRCNTEAGVASATDVSSPQSVLQEDRLLEDKCRALMTEKEIIETQFQEIVKEEKDFKQRSHLVTNRLEAIDDEVALANSQIEVLKVQYQTYKDDIVGINSRMASVQRQILHDDGIEGRERDDADEERLKRMSKRSYDLQCSVTICESQIYDLEQNILVLNQEAASLREELNAKPLIVNQTAENKCKILEKLVSLDRLILQVKDHSFCRNKCNSINKAFIDWEVQGAGNVETNPNMECMSSYEICPTTIFDDAYTSTDEVTMENLAQVQFVDVSKVPDSTIIPTNVGLNRSDTATGLEPIEKAVADGVRQGLKYGIDNLKEKAASNVPWELSPDSIITTLESLTSVEKKRGDAEKICLEKERVLQERLAIALTDTLRKEILGGRQDPTSENASSSRATSSPPIVASAEEAELKLRLEMAAEEYRKLYTEKLKLEKRLAKVQLKQVASGAKLPQSPSARSIKEADNSNGNTGYVCPICGVSFLMTESDLFTNHFEDHLS